MHFLCISSFIPHDCSMKYVLLLFLLTESLSSNSFILLIKKVLSDNNDDDDDDENDDDDQHLTQDLLYANHCSKHLTYLLINLTNSFTHKI